MKACLLQRKIEVLLCECTVYTPVSTRQNNSPKKKPRVVYLGKQKKPKKNRGHPSSANAHFQPALQLAAHVGKAPSPRWLVYLLAFLPLEVMAKFNRKSGLER